MWRAAVETLAGLPSSGGREGVVFCLENLNTAVDHPGTPFARAADTSTLVAAVGSPHLRMNLDLYHAQIGEGNLIELVRSTHHLVGEVQVADVPGRCEPGTGEIRYQAVARALAETGYDGVVALEAWASGTRRRHSTRSGRRSPSTQWKGGDSPTRERRRACWASSSSTRRVVSQSSARARCRRSASVCGTREPTGWSRSRFVGNGYPSAAAATTLSIARESDALGPPVAEHRMDGAADRGRVDRLHGPAERRRDLQQVGHPAYVAGAVGPGPVKDGRVEERRVALAQRQLDVVLLEVRRERRVVEGEIARGVLLGVRQVERRAGLDRHVDVRDCALEREDRRKRVHLRRERRCALEVHEAEVVVAVGDLGLAAGVHDVQL